MLGSTVLEVAIGMAACFGSVALIASSVQEAIASALKLRSKTLLVGVQQLLNDSGLVLAIYNHALANPRSPGVAASIKGIPGNSRPSYIEPLNFARALVDTLRPGLQAFTDLRPALESIKDPQIRQCLCGLYDRSTDRIHFESAVAGWFDSAMDRVAGVYKRQALLFTFLIAFALAIAFNIDACQITTSLWKMSSMNALHIPADIQDKISADRLNAALSILDGLPIGWRNSPGVQDTAWYAPLSTGLGWIITATSALFGAPFWFGLLGRAGNLRGVGEKPKPG